MRVLVANIATRRNRFLGDLNEALSNFCDVTHSSDEFWNMTGRYDVVHMHWPEYITYEIEAAYNSQLSSSLIDDLEERLRFWSARAPIVVTRHNPVPYNAPDDPKWRRLYELVFSYASGVVHMAQASVDEFRNRHVGLPRNIDQDLEHTIIPIQNYSSLPNTVTRAQARRKFRIASDDAVILVFGAIRTDAEKQLILETFSALPLSRKVLLASNWPDGMSKKPGGMREHAVRALRRAANSFRRDVRFNYGYVDDADAQLYLNAADVLFIPRLWLLNSANVSLGMTFGRVTVGPDAGNTGAILKETGNPVFDSEKPATAVAALTAGLKLASEGALGPANQAHALSEWSPERCASKYTAFYQRLRAHDA